MNKFPLYSRLDNHPLLKQTKYGTIHMHCYTRMRVGLHECVGILSHYVWLSACVHQDYRDSTPVSSVLASTRI